MTDLQMSLIAAGGVFVVGVVSYNKWQEYKARKSVERAFSTDHDDVLMNGGAASTDAPRARHEPVLDTGMALSEQVPLGEPSIDTVDGSTAMQSDLTASAPVPNYGPAGAASAGFAQDMALPGTAPGTPPAQLAENLVDPLIDCLIPLNSEGPLRGDRILPALSKLRRVGNKPVHFVGLAVNGDWEPVVHGGVYTRLQAGVQLATRTTALNELEYSEMVTRLRAVGDEIQAEPEVPDMIEVMSEARNLHRFVAAHDAQLGVNMASKGAPWAISTLIGSLENQGFDVRPDGRFAMLDTDGMPLFTLSTNVTLGAETTSRLTLLLDVPCVAPAKDGFGRMVATARELLLRLDAAIVDDFDQPLSDPALEEIAGQVREFYQEMEGADIPAGSTRALRLFV
jgi:hypothetical protein